MMKFNVYTDTSLTWIQDYNKFSTSNFNVVIWSDAELSNENVYRYKD